jgi:hypothetical protein
MNVTTMGKNDINCILFQFWEAHTMMLITNADNLTLSRNHVNVFIVAMSEVFNNCRAKICWITFLE